MTSTLAPDLRKNEVEQRAMMLQALAGRWDQAIMDNDVLNERMGLTQEASNRAADRLVSSLTDLAAEYADPVMPREDIRMWMEDLRDAINALARWECGDGWDGDDTEKAYYSDDMVLALLHQDVDDATYPLLHGGPTDRACFTCRRTHANVWTWRQRIAGSSRCEEHQP